MGLSLVGVFCRFFLRSITQESDTFDEVHMVEFRMRKMKETDEFSAPWRWHTLSSVCRPFGFEPLLTSMLLRSVISHLPWLNADLFKQAITSMASPLFILLLTRMFGYVMGCLNPLSLRRVSVRVATLCTAGACLASNVKPGNLWNLTKASTGRGWKITRIWKL